MCYARKLHKNACLNLSKNDLKPSRFVQRQTNSHQITANRAGIEESGSVLRMDTYNGYAIQGFEILEVVDNKQAVTVDLRGHRIAKQVQDDEVR